MFSNVQNLCQLITDVNDSSGFFIRLSSLCHPFVNSFILKPRVASDRVMLTDAKLQCFQLKQRDQRESILNRNESYVSEAQDTYCQSRCIECCFPQACLQVKLDTLDTCQKYPKVK